MIGTDENDTLIGANAAETLEGGAGADSLDGGANSDTADYSGSILSVTVDLLAGTGSGGDAQGDVLSNIENVTGSLAMTALLAMALLTGSSVLLAPTHCLAMAATTHYWAVVAAISSMAAREPIGRNMMMQGPA